MNFSYKALLFVALVSASQAATTCTKPTITGGLPSYGTTVSPGDEVSVLGSFPDVPLPGTQTNCRFMTWQYDSAYLDFDQLSYSAVRASSSEVVCRVPDTLPEGDFLVYLRIIPFGLESSTVPNECQTKGVSTVYTDPATAKNSNDGVAGFLCGTSSAADVNLGMNNFPFVGHAATRVNGGHTYTANGADLDSDGNLVGGVLPVEFRAKNYGTTDTAAGWDATITVDGVVVWSITDQPAIAPNEIYAITTGEIRGITCDGTQHNVVFLVDSSVELDDTNYDNNDFPIVVVCPDPNADQDKGTCDSPKFYSDGISAARCTGECFEYDSTNHKWTTTANPENAGALQDISTAGSVGSWSWSTTDVTYTVGSVAYNFPWCCGCAE